MSSPTTMRLAGGSLIDLAAIEEQTIPLETVAEALAGITRGNGHWADYNNAGHANNCCRAYLAASSVKHQLTIPGITKACVRGPVDGLFHLTCALACLHHDDGEAIVPDITRPLARVPELRSHVEALKAFEQRARDTILIQHGVPTDSAAWGLSKVVDHWVIEREYAYIAHADPLPEPLRQESRRRASLSYLSLHDDLMAQLAEVRQRLAAA